MPVTEEDVNELLRTLDLGRQEWISGRIGGSPDGAVLQDDDMTLFAPFGGEVVRGLHDLAPRQARAVSQFQGGAGSTELIKAIVAGDTVILVMVQRSEVRFVGREDPHAWVLRITEVFRREGTSWVRLHRHADPLIHRRLLDETLSLLEP